MGVKGLEHFGRGNAIGEIYSVSFLRLVENARILRIVRKLHGQELPLVHFEK